MIKKRLVQLFKLLLVLNLSLFLYSIQFTVKRDNSILETNENNFVVNIEKELVLETNKTYYLTNGSVFKVLHFHKAFLVDLNSLNQFSNISKSNILNFGIYFKDLLNLVKVIKKFIFNLYLFCFFFEEFRKNSMYI